MAAEASPAPCWRRRGIATTLTQTTTTLSKAMKPDRATDNPMVATARKRVDRLAAELAEATARLQELLDAVAAD